MITDMKTANAVGGKTARACDSCLSKRARWYCAADDAFLCKSCDASVHSANQLASRHERVRLGTASSKTTESDSPPAWHHGFTRKARTPRQRKEKEDNITNTFPLVPEIGNDEGWVDEDEEQLLYRVPIFDPFAAELCNVSNEIKKNQPSKDEEPFVMFNDGENVIEGCDMDGNYNNNNSNLHGFAPSDMDLAEFAADVESILGRGFDEDSCGIQGLGLIDCKEEEEECMDVCFEGNNRVKVEDEELELDMKGCHMECGMDVTRETIDWNFDYESPAIGEEDAQEMVAEAQTSMTMNIENKEEVRRKILLRLNYDEVIAAWDNQGSPWTTGTRPEFNPDDCFPDFMGMWPGDIHNQYGSVGGRVDGGREARVSRYREKRRTRLFSKKIRYEVRKLNAEKRPRMKGRFVKRTSFAGAVSGCHPYLINK